MYLSCIFAGKRQKGHPCAFSSHLAQEWTRDLYKFSEGSDKRSVCYLDELRLIEAKKRRGSLVPPTNILHHKRTCGFWA